MELLKKSRGINRAPALVRWLSDHKGGAFAGLTFAVSVSLALFFGLSNIKEPTPRLNYEILKEIDVLDVRTPVDQLSVTFQGEDIQEENLNLRIYAMRVTNTGEVDILKSQFDQDLIWGLRVTDGRVIEARLIESSSSYLNATVNPGIASDDTVEFPKAIMENGQFFAFNMLVLHSKDRSPVIVPLGKIAGIDEITLTKVPVNVEGPGFAANLFAGGLGVQVVRIFIFLVGSIGVLLLGVLAVVLYFNAREVWWRRRIQNSVVVRGPRNQKQREMLTDVYLMQGPAGIRELQIGVNDPVAMEKTAKDREASALEDAASNGNGSHASAAAPSVESLVEIGVLSRDADDALSVDSNFEQSLELLVLELGTSRRFLL